MQDYIFSQLRLESNKDNKIAFQVNLPLLLKIFAAAATIDAESMQARHFRTSAFSMQHIPFVLLHSARSIFAERATLHART